MDNLKLTDLLDEFRTSINYHRFDEQYIIDVAVRRFNKLFKLTDTIKVLEILLDEFDDTHSLQDNTIYAIENYLNLNSHA
ncbi:MAG: hypothetical protein RIB01_15365 [Balneola sp.]